ncbi:hypothetical protein O181_102708 [Austropuccinia psidii MF-1]|uniref:Uncharacterized protein n=1 Tax=Austropuccinia psidii MF-1 TaxID=1389203 RepID=A0A9Q3JIY8_9BASI|nr:hypothetical protein [Austropuccinia psidii MF-1]
MQHSPPARQKRFQARAQAVPTANPRVPLDSTPAVPQLRAQFNREPHSEVEEPSRKEGIGTRRLRSFSGVVGGFKGPWRTTSKGPGEDGEEEEENCVEKEGSDGTEGVSSTLRESQGIGVPTLAQYDKHVSHLYEPSLLEIMQQMTQTIANLQGALSS